MAVGLSTALTTGCQSSSGGGGSSPGGTSAQAVPNVSPVPNPAPSPVPNPSPLPDPIPAPAPAPIPSPTPNPVSPAPAPNPIPSPNPIPLPLPSPGPMPVPAPSPTPINPPLRCAVETIIVQADDLPYVSCTGGNLPASGGEIDLSFYYFPNSVTAITFSTNSNGICCWTAHILNSLSGQTSVDFQCGNAIINNHLVTN